MAPVAPFRESRRIQSLGVQETPPPKKKKETTQTKDGAHDGCSVVNLFPSRRDYAAHMGLATAPQIKGQTAPGSLAPCAP